MLVVKGGEKLPTPDVIKTPSFGLNYILSGGFWTGRYHIIWGNPQAGKTTMALHILAEAQRMGYVPVIIDAEGSCTDEWLEYCGVDIDSRIIIRSTRLEDIEKQIMPMLREQGSKYVFLIDSINSIVKESFYKNDDGGSAIGIYARSQGEMFQKFSDIVISNTDHMFIMIAQQTTASKGQFFVTAGKFGKSAEHWASNIIQLTAGNAKTDKEVDDDERILSRMVTWKIEKSKQGPIMGTKGEYWFSPETAHIDQAREAFHLGVRNGIIEKSGKWYKWNGESYNGEAKILAALGEEDIEQIIRELNTLDEWDFDKEED